MTDAQAVRARYHEALARRLQAAPEAVQRALQQRLAAALPDAADSAPAPQARAARPAARHSPLAQLNQHIASATALPGAVHGELRSAQAFGDSWARISASDAVLRAVQRGPDQPGPLNSHRLVLRTLSLLNGLSPDYLRRFLSHADTLLWLHEASARLKAAPPAKPRKPRPKA